MAHLDRLSELKARLQAATQGPWKRETSSEGTAVSGLRIGAGGIGFDAGTRAADVELIANAQADLRWAVEEIDYLRRYIEVLGDLAYALDALRWALENPVPGRLQRRRMAFEEARQALLATPNWREGECHGGCRRYATHEFVIEQGDSVEREPCCEECGALWLAARQSAIAAGDQPAATLRLEPIAPPHDETKEVLQ